jgi:hypothetical protein
MSSILPVPSSTSPIASKPASNPAQAPAAASSSVFGNLLRKTEVAIGMRSQSGFTSGATYEAQSLSGQTKAFFNNTVNATKSVLHIK